MKKEIITIILVLLIMITLFVLSLGYGLGWYRSSSKKVIYKYTNHEIVNIKEELSYMDGKLKVNILKIHSFLTDTLTDREEGEVLKLIEKCKGDTTLNKLLNKLGESGLLKNLVGRWEEEALIYEDPTLFDKALAFFKGKSLPKKPQNKFYENKLFSTIFTYKDLSIDAGRYVLSAFNYRSGYGDFNSPKDTNQGLQISMAILLNKNRLYYLSDGTLELAREVFTNYVGNPSFNNMVNVGRKKLGMDGY